MFVSAEVGYDINPEGGVRKLSSNYCNNNG
jgi:hypothetical protein